MQWHSVLSIMRGFQKGSRLSESTLSQSRCIELMRSLLLLGKLNIVMRPKKENPTVFCVFSMAVLKKLEDQLNCSICLDTYTNPKQLQCHHVYCQQCLVRLDIRDKQGQLFLTCPNCRQVTPIPANGVAGLQAAFRVNKLLEIVEEHKKAKVATASPEESESASISHTPHGNITVGCPEHGGIEVQLYCETCGETICWKCIMKGSKHHSHEYQELNKAFETYKEEIISLLEPIEKQLTTIEKALAQLDMHCDRISDQRVAIKADIHDTIARLHETPDVNSSASSTNSLRPS